MHGTRHRSATRYPLQVKGLELARHLLLGGMRGALVSRRLRVVRLGGLQNGSRDMDYVKPADLACAMVNAGRSKLALPPLDLVIRGGLAGGILAAATSLAITGAVQTNVPLVGALVFPVGLILIVLLGLDLVTGSFGLLPLPWLENDADTKTMLANWGWVFLGNLIGSVVYGGLLAIALTNFGATAPAGVAAKIVA